MTVDNSFVVVRTATTPAEAKVLVALLQAEGVQALVDGDSLADEIAVSRRAMNLNGVQVRVPARQLDEAKEILDAARVDDSELEAQALAAGPSPGAQPEAPRAPAEGRGRTSLVVALIAVPLAILFFTQWMNSAAAVRAFERASTRGGKLRFERMEHGWHWFDATTGHDRIMTLDKDDNGIPELTTWFDADGHAVRSDYDSDQDGVPDGSEEDLAEGTRLFLMRGAGPQRYHVLVRAADGTILRRQHLDGKNGFVDDR